MSNHYHLLVRTRRDNLSRFVQRLNTSYALYYRYKHDRPGHVFQGRYTAKLVEGDTYLRRLTRYIHLNPVKTSDILSLGTRQRIAILSAYPWSSYPGYVSVQHAVPWLDYRVLKSYGRSSTDARARYRHYVEAMVAKNDSLMQETLSANSYAVGDERFVHTVEERLHTLRMGTVQDQDVALPKATVPLEKVNQVVATAYGVSQDRLRSHGHIGGMAKTMAVEIAARMSGLTQREIGQHYGGISSAAVSMIRRKVRLGRPNLQLQLVQLAKQCIAGY